MNNVKGILIDYGGTIDTGGNHWFAVFRAIYPALYIVIEEAILREAYIYAEQQLELDSASINPDDTFKDILRRKVDYQFDYLKKKKKLPMLKKDKAALVEAAYVFARGNAQDSAQVLRKLAKQYPLVLVSNFYGNLQAVLNDFGIADCFQTIIESASVGIRKPSPEIFRLGIHHLGLQPAEVAIVGDSHKNDIAPGQLLGCKTIWLKGQGWDAEETDNPAHTADRIINKIAELLEVLK